ncbi:MAG: DUF3301 domain-containing protein [Sedimenticolaceae bacterium]
MQVVDITPLLLIAFLVWLWFDSTRSHELAVQITSRLCLKHDVQLLDETVALRRLGVNWPREGLRLKRTYRFDYTIEGTERRTGSLVLLGSRLAAYHIDSPSQETVVSIS